VARVDIAAAGDQQPIDPLIQRAQHLFILDHRYDQRHTAGRHDRIGIGFAQQDRRWAPIPITKCAAGNADKGPHTPSYP
jgi:hypothetical protein